MATSPCCHTGYDFFPLPALKHRPHKPADGRECLFTGRTQRRETEETVDIRVMLMQYATESTKIREIAQVKQAMMNVVPNIFGKSNTLRSVNSTL